MFDLEKIAMPSNIARLFLRACQKEVQKCAMGREPTSIQQSLPGLLCADGDRVLRYFTGCNGSLDGDI